MKTNEVVASAGGCNKFPFLKNYRNGWDFPWLILLSELLCNRRKFCSVYSEKTTCVSLLLQTNSHEVEDLPSTLLKSWEMFVKSQNEADEYQDLIFCGCGDDLCITCNLLSFQV